MRNRFYGEFDYECFGRPRKADYRTPFQVDRDRIVHTSAFRRLQGKTQVFWSGEYDFYRTRLTHSLEVAQIGKSIANWLRASSEHLGDDHHLDNDLIEAICLSHDIGHAPFGHAGERSLNELMASRGGFEGNAQTLRLIASTIYATSGARAGMSPTRAFLDGVLKYKALREELEAVGEDPPAHHFLYDDQRAAREFAFGGWRPPGGDLAPQTLNRLKSLECQIMDWADDTAYCLHDIADGVAAGFLDETSLRRWSEGQPLDGEQADVLEGLLGVIRARRLNVYVGKKINEFIHATSLEPIDHALGSFSARYRYRLRVESRVLLERELYGTIARDLVYESPQVHQLELKARHVLGRLFEVLCENYLGSSRRRLHLLPAAAEEGILAEGDDDGRARLICDQLAGMTDGFASRTYKRLFDPDFGSIVDLV